MYAETGTAMRTELAALLQHHRIQQAIGAQGDDPNARAERAVRGSLIRRYRQSLLVWCVASAETARSLAFTNLPQRATNPFHPRKPEEPTVTELLRSLRHAVDSSPDGLASLDELTASQPSSLMERWRQAARAGVLAEHDTGHDAHGRLSTAQCQALLGDVAAVTQALIVLDRRYLGTPGWVTLKGARRLTWAAIACATDVGLGQPDYSVDTTGWRPPVKQLRGPVQPGMAGVLQAEHNLMVRLRTFPAMINLRRVVDSQRLVSHRLAAMAQEVDPSIGRRWEERAEIYALVQQQLRDIGGNLGKGGLAAAEGANAVSRLQRVTHQAVLHPRQISTFQTLFDGIDNRVADIVVEGVRRGAFVERVPLPRVVDSSARMIHPIRERFAVPTSSSDLDIVRTVRLHLRHGQPHAVVPRPDESRARLHAALIQRPARPADGPSL